VTSTVVPRDSLWWYPASSVAAFLSRCALGVGSAAPLLRCALRGCWHGRHDGAPHPTRRLPYRSGWGARLLICAGADDDEDVAYLGSWCDGCCAAQINGYFSPFFCGAQEISSVSLGFVDIFKSFRQVRSCLPGPCDAAALLWRCHRVAMPD
jgi:hypothetical protein